MITAYLQYPDDDGNFFCECAIIELCLLFEGSQVVAEVDMKSSTEGIFLVLLSCSTHCCVHLFIIDNV